VGELMIQIGELSDRTGCNIETIRYYERIGVMAEPRRRGRYRSYGRIPPWCLCGDDFWVSDTVDDSCKSA